jgi:hypothetical protein
MFHYTSQGLANAVNQYKPLYLLELDLSITSTPPGSGTNRGRREGNRRIVGATLAVALRVCWPVLALPPCWEAPSINT